MARTTLAIQQVVDEGVVPTYSAANVDGHAIEAGGDVWLHVKNGAGAPINVTVQTGATLEGEAVADKIVAVANGAEKLIGPFPPSLYARPTGAADQGKVYVDFSSVTTITCGAFRV